MEVSGKTTVVPSEPCEICQTHGADGFCRECTEYMCKECFDHHVKAKPCRHHTLCSLDQGPIQIATKSSFERKCDLHGNENLKYYCHKHEVIGCGDCMISNHDGCKPKLISNLATNFEESDEFKEILNKLSEFKAESNKNMKRVQNNLKENKDMVDKALSEIRKFRKDINDYLDQAEKAVITEANKYSNKNESSLSELQAKIATVSKEVDGIRNKLDTNMHQGVDLFIRMVECKPRVRQVEQTVAEIKLSNTCTVKAYIFEPDQTLRDLLTLNIKFGCMEWMKSEDSEQEQNKGGLYEMQANSENISKNKQPMETKQFFKQRNRNRSRKNVRRDPVSKQTAPKEEEVNVKAYSTTDSAQQGGPNAAAWAAYYEQYYDMSGVEYGQQSQSTVNPQTGQPDYSQAWADYYRHYGMYHQADAILAQQQAHQGEEDGKGEKPSQ